MSEKKYILLTHGGAGSKNEYQDGALKAADKGVHAINSGASVMDVVCHAVAELEDDSRFNAGMGSHPRADGSVEMDAAVMDSLGNFGAVAALTGYKNPIHVAKTVTRTQYKVLAGAGAAQFAETTGLEPMTRDQIRATGTDFSTDDSATDTVGCVAFDGQNFAAGLSTGGIKGSLPGRVGDVPLIGCGLYAGTAGAVAATGDGESITMHMTAIRAYQMIERGDQPEKVLEEIMSWFNPDDSPFGLIIINRNGYAGGSNRTMAWAAVSKEK
ncbi:Isoaspartyl aminopeptidase @ Asp-X dipeptidase [hydrothermal vent metagenome]|uniref:Isoaspartyl aminopeptidase @ Asp-X dipeptidase n=1 Tax=hydrothermal vent metagenome TaxID=652676 RepID=A0A3B1D154_9ZZZZ